MTRKMQYFILFIRGDVDPEKYGPFSSEDRMNEEALRLRKEEGKDEGGIFPVEAEGEFTVGCYSGGFFTEDEPDPSESQVPTPTREITKGDEHGQ